MLWLKQLAELAATVQLAGLKNIYEKLLIVAVSTGVFLSFTSYINAALLQQPPLLLVNRA